MASSPQPSDEENKPSAASSGTGANAYAPLTATSSPLAYSPPNPNQLTPPSPQAGLPRSTVPAPNLTADPYSALTMDSAPMAPQLPTPRGVGPQSTSGGASPTGFLNFGDYYSANKDVAQREASNLSSQAKAQAQGAQKEEGDAYKQYQQLVSNGTLKTPDQQQQWWAEHGDTGVDYGKTVQSAHFETGEGGSGGTNDTGRSTVTESQALSGESTRSAANGNDTGNTPMPDGPAATQGDVKSAVQSGAQGDYSGPMSMADLQQFAKLAKDTKQAEMYADALGGGNSGVQAAQGGTSADAALTGAAGRGDFADLAQRYGGPNGLTSKLIGDTVASGAQAQAAIDQSATARAAYQGLLDNYQQRVDSDAAAAKANADASDARFDAAKADAKKRVAWDKLQGDKGNARNVLHQIAKYMSPADIIADMTGHKAPIDALGQWFAKEGVGTHLGGDAAQFGEAPVSQAWGSGDYDVYASMTDADWAAFNDMSYTQQQKWIADRKGNLKGGR